MLFDSQLILVSIFYRTTMTEATTEVAFWENSSQNYVNISWEMLDKESNRSHKSWVIVLKIHLMTSVFRKPFNEL